MIEYNHQDKRIIEFNNFDICIDDNYAIIIYRTYRSQESNAKTKNVFCWYGKGLKTLKVQMK